MSSKQDKTRNPSPVLQNLAGWCAVVLVTAAASFWSFWGAIEAFHEGWCKPSLAGRLIQTLFYLTPAIVITSLSTIGVRWPKIGATMMCLTSGAMVVFLFKINANFSPFIVATLTAVPLLVGLLYFYGRPRPRRLALVLAVGIPMIVLVGFGVEPVTRVAKRFDDGDRSLRVVEGNGVNLVWAPHGPGWTRHGNVTWQESLKLVNHLSKDGLTIEDEPQHFWRLPTRGEIVCSLTRGNKNSGGVWEAESQSATYQVTPDKESPIWDSHAPLIYLWTSESASEDRAWIVVYHGGVHSKSKALGASSLGFRAVRQPDDSTLK